MSATTQSRRRLTAATWVDVAVLTALILLAVAGFEPAFGRYSLLTAAVGGVLVGGGCAIVCRLVRMPAALSVAVAIAAYFAFGSALAMPRDALFGVLPTLDTLSGLVLGAVFGWSDAVTLQAPLEAPPYVAVVPYVATWLVTFVTLWLATGWFAAKPRSAAVRALLILGPLAVFAAAILTGTRDPYFAAVRGVVFAAAALAWLGWRRRHSTRVRGASDAGLVRRKILGTAIVVVGAVAVGSLAGAAIAPAPAARFVLRDQVTPPFDPLEHPSPLAGFRHYTKDLRKTKLFTVSGLRDGEVLRLATMDRYDGIVWRMTGPGEQTDGSGSFELLGRTIPAPALFTPGFAQTAHVTVSGYDDVWLPNLGYVTDLSFGAGAGDPEANVRVNTATGTSAVTSGVRSGMSYTMRVSTQKVPSDKQLAHVAPAKLAMPAVNNVPDVVGAKAEEFAGHSASAIQKLRNIERSFKTLGYLSHGRASDPVPSRAGEGADRMSDLLTKQPMVGDQEQYASAFALMARHLGYPARVVIGFKPSLAKGATQATVTGDDVTAWAEVAFDGVGWLPFFPTPDKTDAPKDQLTKPKPQPQPQVRQPPRMNPKTGELLTPVKTKKSNPPDKHLPFELPGWVYVAGIVVGVLLALYFVPLGVIALLKRRRRRRRQTTGPPHRRAAGAWDELVDRYAELGFTVPPNATRSQTAAAVTAQSATEQLPVPPDGYAGLAARVDSAVFAGEEVTPEHAESLWRESDESFTPVTRRVSWLRSRMTAFRYRRRRKK